MNDYPVCPHKIKLFFLILCALVCSAVWQAAAYDFYWENPVSVLNADGRFPSAAYNDRAAAVIWQETRETAERQGQIWLSAQIYDGGKWTTKNRFAGPFPYSGEIPAISSVAVNSSGTVAAAVLSSIHTISVFVTDDHGATFTETKLSGYTIPLVAPRIYGTSDGGYVLFVTQGENESFSLLTAHSEDGKSWTQFSRFEPSVSFSRAFLPIMTSTDEGDIAVFQAFYDSESRSSAQLYTTLTNDGGKTWTPPVLITDFSLAETGDQPFYNFHNQRPNVFRINGQLHLVWERSYSYSESGQIYYAELDSSGRLKGLPERISSGAGSCNNPVLFDFRGTVSVVWFDDRRGMETVYMAQRTGYVWEETQISGSQFSCSFGQHVMTGNDLRIFWPQAAAGENQQIVRLSPDRTVLPPSVRPLSFTEGQRSTSEKVQAEVRLPSDSSGIAGFSYIWTRNAEENPPERLMNLSGQTRLTLTADEDGPWYLKVRVLDYAGNWSSPASVVYFRDTTPPGRPVLARPSVLADGYMASNTFSVEWTPPPDDDVAGYTYSFEYLAPADTVAVLQASALSAAYDGDPGSGAETAASGTAEQTDGDTPDMYSRLAGAAAARFSPVRPSGRPLLKDTSVRYDNRDNGIYAFSVSAVDTVGNIGESAVMYLFLNKYVPYTVITWAETKTDSTGNVFVSLHGKGYTQDGRINTIYIDKDGAAPYDRVLTAEAGQFTVSSDRLITGIMLSDLEEGSYRIGLVHPARGLYMSGRLFSVTEFGTVKFGDYTHEFVPSWEVKDQGSLFRVQFADIVIWTVLVFAVFGLAVSVRGIVHTTKDAVQVRQEVLALLKGDSLPQEKKRKAASLRRKGISLRFKLVFFTTALVMMVIVAVSVPLGIMMIRTQEQTLAQGLQERVYVLLESLSSGARAYLPSQNILELGFLPSQSSALEEAVSSTITGLPADGTNVNPDYLWATNDSAIAEKTDSMEIVYGKTRLTDDVSVLINEECISLNEKAVASVGEIARSISELTAEGISLALRTDAESTRRRDEIQSITRSLNETLTVRLNELAADGTGSWPSYDSASLSRENTSYVFYRPVLYRQGADMNFVRGVVRVEITTDKLLGTVDSVTSGIINTILLIALIAVSVGIAGALILSSVIISPIRRLASHVAMIRDTDDKQSLEGKDIVIKSRDEIGLLGETVNDMTHGLVKAAAAAKDLTVGKEVQKMFIPLETDAGGRKLTTGSSEDDGAEFFGYYEGAKGVSGDYFDYIKLDNRHYAVIKCDVAGKGVPAALIMVEVATLFLNYFRDWIYEKNGYRLGRIVSLKNALIASRGF